MSLPATNIRSAKSPEARKTSHSRLELGRINYSKEEIAAKLKTVRSLQNPFAEHERFSRMDSSFRGGQAIAEAENEAEKPPEIKMAKVVVHPAPPQEKEPAGGFKQVGPTLGLMELFASTNSEISEAKPLLPTLAQQKAEGLIYV